MHRQWQQGQVSWEEHRDAVWLCRDGVRRAKAWLKLNLERDAKNNSKGFYRYVSQKRKVKESVRPLMNKNDDLVSTDEEKAEVLSNFFLPHSSLVISLLTPPESMDHKTGTRGVKPLPLKRKIRFRTT